MGDIVDAAGKYGGLAGVILALAVVVLVAVITKKASLDSRVFKLAVGSLVFLATLSLLILASSFLGERARNQNHTDTSQEHGKPAGQPAAPPPDKKQLQPSFIRVSGSVTPIPTAAARVTIVGKHGSWPIDAEGAFDFRVQGRARETGEVRIFEGNKVVYDGYQELSRHFSVRISE